MFCYLLQLSQDKHLSTAVQPPVSHHLLREICAVERFIKPNSVSMSIPQEIPQQYLKPLEAERLHKWNIEGCVSFRLKFIMNLKIQVHV